MEFEESIIPKFVWDFVKKHTSSIVVAGILAMIIWSYMKKHQKESLKSLNSIEKDQLKRLNTLLEGFSLKELENKVEDLSRTWIDCKKNSKELKEFFPNGRIKSFFQLQ